MIYHGALLPMCKTTVLNKEKIINNWLAYLGVASLDLVCIGAHINTDPLFVCLKLTTSNSKSTVEYNKLSIKF